MNANSIVAKGRNHVETLADDEIVLMHVENGRFFTLAGTGRRVWDLMAEPIAIDTLAGRLVDEFAVEKDACVDDLLALFGQLEAGGLVDVSG